MPDASASSMRARATAMSLRTSARALPVTLEKRGRFLVAVPQRKVPALTTEIVERTRRKIRRER